MKDTEMWEAYKKLDPQAKEYKSWAFGGNSDDMPDILAGLVCSGIKTATASAYPCYEFEFEPIPEPGEINIILSKAGEAVCVTKTTKVYVTPFNKVTSEHAFKEGEDDRSLSFWRNCHKQVFTLEMNEIGKTFTEDMPVVCEEFKVVYPTA